MHYYINWALCNLPTFILTDRGRGASLSHVHETRYLLEWIGPILLIY